MERKELKTKHSSLDQVSKYCMLKTQARKNQAAEMEWLQEPVKQMDLLFLEALQMQFYHLER